MTRDSIRQRQTFAARKRHLGIGLLEVLLLLFILGGVLTAGALLLQNQTKKQEAEQQIRLLKQAESQLRGFAAAHYRLPCPAFADTDGVESCNKGAKGLLPWRTLGIDAANARGNLAKLAYLVQSSTLPLVPTDLTVAAHRFEPTDWDGKVIELDADVNSQDFCQALVMAADASSAGVNVTDGTNSRRIAYALAHPGHGDADGDGNLFDGRNANSSSEMELPEREHINGSYDDRVLAISFSELRKTFNCPSLTDSISGMALSVNVIDEVRAQKGWATASATVLTTINGVKLGVQAGKYIAAGITMTSSVAVLGTAVGQLASATLGCIFLAGCVDIPRALAATVAGTTATVQSGLAVAANAAAIASHAIATGITASVMIRAGLTIEDSNFDVHEAKDKACKASEDAKDELAKAETERTKATNAYNTALNTQGSAWGTMLSLAHTTVDQANKAAKPQTSVALTSKDHVFDELNAAIDDWLNKEIIKNNAKADLDRAKKIPSSTSSSGSSSYNDEMRDKLQDEIDEEKAKTEPDEEKIENLQNALDTLNEQIAAANSTAKQIQGLKDQIAELQKQINKETDADRLAELKSQQSSLRNQLATLDSGVDGKQAIFDDASSAARTAEIKLFGVNGDAGVREDVIWTFRIFYCVTTAEEKDKDGKVTKPASTDCNGNIDNRNAMRTAVDSYIDARKKSVTAKYKKDTAEGTYNNAASISSKTQASCALYTAKEDEMLDDFINNKPSDTTKNIPEWVGGGAILREADLKGGVK